MPAFFNGIYGHKPSKFRCVNDGQFPGDKRDNIYLTTGPLCRYVEDLLPMFRIMTGPKNSSELGLDNKVDFTKQKLKVLRYK